MVALDLLRRVAGVAGVAGVAWVRGLGASIVFLHNSIVGRFHPMRTQPRPDLKKDLRVEANKTIRRGRQLPPPVLTVSHALLRSMSPHHAPCGVPQVVPVCRLLIGVQVQ